jgi:hypothetical protein
MKPHESDHGAESSIRIDILASLRNQFVSRDSATTCAQQDCKGDTARTEFESNYEEIIYAKLCGHTPQACASPSELAWTSREWTLRLLVLAFFLTFERRKDINFQTT